MSLSKTIEMVDLHSQYLRLKPEIDQAVSAAMESSVFINGPDVKAFRLELSEYLGIPHIIPCANGTDALQVALMALPLEPGDEVITPNFTFISTVEVLVLLKLKPVLVDVDPVTFNLNPEEVRKAITRRTKAIIPVHLFGQSAPMDEILEIANQHGLYVIEDNAQSLGAHCTSANGQTHPTGGMGLIGTTSFFPTKPLGCYGDGGALMTHDDGIAEKLQMIVNHGAKIKYYHDLIGVNSRLDTLQAAILRVNLRHLDDFIRRRREAARYYDSRLGGHPRIQIPGKAPFTDHVYHQYTLVIMNADRERIRQRMKEAGIPTMVYYPVPLSLQKAFSFAGYKPGDFPVTEKLCSSVLSLPIHTEMEMAELDYICSTLLNIIDNEQ
jgi:dTDP-4-amino-4,6-dideoxygalactose transaminase